MVVARVLGVFAGALLVAACSDQGGKQPEPAKDSKPEPPALAPEPIDHTPSLPSTNDRDADGNRLDDVFDRRLASAGADARLLDESVSLQVILTAAVTQNDLDGFVALGGKLDYVFRELRYGFIGTLPLGQVKAVQARFAHKLHLIAAPRETVPFLDEATRTGRVRGIWAASFAGSASGYAGNSNITIAVVDTGVDESHTDLNGRKQGWMDYTSDLSATAHDVEGHGTHVTSIALGTGAAFGSATGTLKFTQSGTLSGVPAGNFQGATIHTPKYLGGGALSASASAKFLGGASTTFYLLSAADPAITYNAISSTFGASPLSLPTQTGSTDMIYQGGLAQSTPAGVTNFAVTNTVANYPSVGDGFNTLRGVAPSCQWFGAKVFTDAGTGSDFDIEKALDDIAKNRVARNVKVVNMSLGVTAGGLDSDLRTAVNDVVKDGIAVVVAAGNDGPSTAVGDPARASNVITVGATNDVNELTSYTSIGTATLVGGDDTKPDVLAPGGSSYRSGILAADSNSQDGNTTGFADLVANDYSSLQGTSMASPFVSGSVALMIDALQQSGTAWSFTSKTQPLFLKMLLLASATELNVAREQGMANSPTLGRGTKDLFEGYGIINPDAAIEAMLQTFVSPLSGSASNTAPARLEWERRAWGRKLSLVNGATVILNLSVPSTADYDLYLYAGSDDGNGNPIIRKSSTNAGNDTDESISYTSSATETAYMFVKRVSGFGTFSLTGSAVSHCGDGHLDTGEQCDPAIAGSTTCCTSTCASVTNGTSCDDGNACTKTDTCQFGTCSAGAAVTCSAQDQCHDAGSCDTSTGKCSNPSKTDGVTCDDSNACTKSDTCVGGICTGASPVTCSASDQCHDAGSCDTSTGKCSNPNKTDGVTCDDSNACTKTDTCQAGKCSGASPVTCTASDQCHVAGTCDTSTGLCSNPASADGTTCSDGDQCTQSDTCQAGACTAGTAVKCTASDQCHDVGGCDSATGKCSNPTKTDGASCDDKNSCTQTDTCQSGKCSGASPVACAASDQCHDAGTCAPATGKCSNPNKTDGATCDDGNACTKTDTCTAGACGGASPVTCTAADQCHVAGTCDTSTGTCSNPSKADGVACNDGNKCTQTDTCVAGTCSGASPVTCAASDQCHDVGICAPATGKCSNPNKTDGVACNDGNLCTQTDTCVKGACSGANPVACAASDQCHVAGTCDVSTGACSNPNKADGVVCNDGNKCTQVDTCVAGACSGASPVACAASDQCHDVGVCDAASGTCSSPPKADGAVCNDGNFCTQIDGCVAGVCAGGSPVVCTASDQCHDVGACDPASGTCSNPSSGDGASCNDGNGCTQGDVCNAGACAPGADITCAAPDECHLAGLCQSPGGTCSYAAKPDGSACGVQGSCQAGACVEANNGNGGAGGGSGTGGTSSGGTVGGVAGSASGNGGSSGGGSSSGGSNNGGDAAAAGSASGGTDVGTAGSANGGSATSGGADTAAEGGVNATAEGGEGARSATGDSGGSVATADVAAPHQSSGCSCDIPGAPEPPRYGALLLVGAAVLVQRARRRAA